MTGELDSHKKRLAELETKCKSEFDCTIEELPDIAEGLKAEAQKFIVEAENILDLRKSGGEQEFRCVDGDSLT